MTTLRKMFADTSILTDKNTQPLGVDAFLRRVLVPETGVMLIQEDNCISRKEAITVLKESRAFGLAGKNDE